MRTIVGGKTRRDLGNRVDGDQSSSNGDDRTRRIECPPIHSQASGSSSKPPSRVPFSNPPRASTMASISQPPKGRDGVLSTLDVFIQTLNLAKDTCGIPPAQAAFGAASFLLTMIRVRLPPLCEGRLLTRIHPGHNGKRSGLRRAWAGLH